MLLKWFFFPMRTEHRTTKYLLSFHIQLPQKIEFGTNTHAHYACIYVSAPRKEFLLLRSHFFFHFLFSIYTCDFPRLKHLVMAINDAVKWTAAGTFIYVSFRIYMQSPNINILSLSIYICVKKIGLEKKAHKKNS